MLRIKPHWKTFKNTTWGTRYCAALTCRPDVKPYPSEDNPLLAELGEYLETSGINDPFAKIYITTEPIENFACLMFLFVISQVSKFQYNDHLSTVNTLDTLTHDRYFNAQEGQAFIRWNTIRCWVDHTTETISQHQHATILGVSGTIRESIC